jgi:hypothetical protein
MTAVCHDRYVTSTGGTQWWRTPRVAAVLTCLWTFIVSADWIGVAIGDTSPAHIGQAIGASFVGVGLLAATIALRRQVRSGAAPVQAPRPEHWLDRR